MKNMCCPITGVYIPRFLLSTIVGFGVLFGLEYLIHHILLMDIYEQTMHLWRPMEEMNAFFPYMLGFQILFVALLAIIFTRNFENKGIGEGIRFGILLGLPIGLLSAGAYIWMPIPLELAGAWFAAGLVECLALGIVFSLTYKECDKGKK